MTLHAKITPQSRKNSEGFCEPCINYAKMKVEVEDQSISPSAPQGSLQGTPRADGNSEHLIVSGERTCTPARKEGAVMTEFDDFELDFAPKRSLQIDYEKWQGYLDDPSLSQEQKEQIITAIWQIMMAFVDLGFEVHPVQEACGQLGSSLDLEGETDSNESKPLELSTTFNAVAP